MKYYIICCGAVFLLPPTTPRTRDAGDLLPFSSLPLSCSFLSPLFILSPLSPFPIFSLPFLSFLVFPFLAFLFPFLSVPFFLFPFSLPSLFLLLRRVQYLSGAYLIREFIHERLNLIFQASTLLKELVNRTRVLKKELSGMQEMVEDNPRLLAEGFGRPLHIPSTFIAEPLDSGILIEQLVVTLRLHEMHQRRLRHLEVAVPTGCPIPEVTTDTWPADLTCHGQQHAVAVARLCASPCKLVTVSVTLHPVYEGAHIMPHACKVQWIFGRAFGETRADIHGVIPLGGSCKKDRAPRRNSPGILHGPDHTSYSSPPIAWYVCRPPKGS